jgi:hypothetical protein
MPKGQETGYITTHDWQGFKAIVAMHMYSLLYSFYTLHQQLFLFNYNAGHNVCISFFCSMANVFSTRLTMD